MNRFFKGLFLIVMLLGAVNAFAASAVEIKNKFDQIIQRSGIKKERLGLYAADSRQEILYNLNGDKHFIPASITKLITAAAVANSLQPDFKCHTQIYIDGVQQGETLDGNIYLKGGGDPAFVSEKMWMLVNEFTREGIRKIKGQIIVDESIFDTERFDPGRESERNDRAYDAPVGGLSFNWNSTTIYVRPAGKAGEKAKVFIDPESSYIHLVNKVTTAAKGTDIVASRRDLKDSDEITVSGKIVLGGPEKHIYKNISNPALYAGANFKEFLRQRHIEVQGGVSGGRVAEKARLAVDFAGDPLSKLLVDMNKFSNNFVAEMLAKNLGSYKTGSQGKMKDGLDAIRKFLTDELKWDASSFNLSNVSGFTRKNSLSPEQFVTLLIWVQKQFRLFPEFLQSLPIAGIDGTLEKRMKDTPGQRWVRAKTGLLNGVVALSGFAGRSDEGIAVFAFMYNGGGDEAHVRSVFDSLAAALVK